MISYQQAQEGIAEEIAVNEMGLCEWTNWETLPQCYKDTVFYPLAAAILAKLFTPEQIEEWKKGGDYYLINSQLYWTIKAILKGIQAQQEKRGIDYRTTLDATLEKMNDMEDGFRRVKGE